MGNGTAPTSRMDVNLRNTFKGIFSQRAVECAVLVGESPISRIKRFTTVRGVQEESREARTASGTLSESAGDNESELHLMSIGKCDKPESRATCEMAKADRILQTKTIVAEGSAFGRCRRRSHVEKE